MATWNCWNKDWLGDPHILPFEIGKIYKDFMTDKEEINNRDGQAAERLWCALMINASHRDIKLDLDGQTFVKSILAGLGGMKVNPGPISTLDMYRDFVSIPSKLQSYLNSSVFHILHHPGNPCQKKLLDFFLPLSDIVEERDVKSK